MIVPDLAEEKPLIRTPSWYVHAVFLVGKLSEQSPIKIYYYSEGEIKYNSICFIIDEMTLDTTFVCLFQKAITTSVKDLPLNVKNVLLSKIDIRHNITTMRVFCQFP